MKRKKGFVFIETLVVVAILTLSLLMTYSSYNASVVREKSRIRYNDAAFLYRTYYISQFFRNFRLDLVASNVSDMNLFVGFNCQNTSIFVNEEDNIGYCETLFDSYQINNIYLTLNDLGYLQDCKSYGGKCEALGRVNDDFANFVKTIGGNGKYGYRLIVEFALNKDGSTCTKDNCIYYYTTLSLGDV